MKLIILITLAICGTLSTALPNLGNDPSIKDFEKEYSKLYTSSEEAEAEANLKANEKQIDAQNQLFADGKSTYQEAVMEWDDLSTDEFTADKTGALDGTSSNNGAPEMDLEPVHYFATGALDNDENREEMSAEDQAYLEATIYNVSDRSYPSSIDFRQYSKFQFCHSRADFQN